MTIGNLIGKSSIRLSLINQLFISQSSISIGFNKLGEQEKVEFGSYNNFAIYTVYRLIIDALVNYSGDDTINKSVLLLPSVTLCTSDSTIQGCRFVPKSIVNANRYSYKSSPS